MTEARPAKKRRKQGKMSPGLGSLMIFCPILILLFSFGIVIVLNRCDKKNVKICQIYSSVKKNRSTKILVLNFFNTYCAF